MPVHRSRVLSFLLLPLVACSGGGAAETPGGGPARAVAVSVAPVARADIAREVTLSGPVEPVRTVGVNSRMAGTVLGVRVVEGDRVRPGQLMVELDARENEAQLNRARAVFQGAEAAFNRAQQLRESQIITDAEFESTRASYQTARSDLDLWEARIEFSRVLAPVTGVVTLKHVEAGSAVGVNQRLIDIAEDSLLVVRVRMSELDVVHVNPGDSTVIQLDAYPGVEMVGRVLRVFPAADPETRLVPVEVAIVGRARAEVRPGFLARVTFPLERRPASIVVPAAAIGSGNNTTWAWVVDADTLIRRPVTTGLTADGQVEVLAGLTEGEQVVTSGQVNLRSGSAVRVVGRSQ